MHRNPFILQGAVPTSALAVKRLIGLAVLVILIVGPLVGAEKEGERAPLTATPAAEALALDKKILAEAKSASELMANLGYLSDIIGPRLTGSPALKRANEWTAEKMRSYGLTNVQLEPYTIPVGWERGNASARLVEPNNGRSLIVAAMGWSPGTNGKIEGDVVVITAKSPEELKSYKGKLKNAIVLRGPPATIRPINEPSRPPFTDQGGSPRGRRGQQPTETGEDKPAPPKADQPPAPEKSAQKAAPEKTPPAPTGFDQRPGRQFSEMMAMRREIMDMMRAEGAAAVLQDAGKPHGLLTTTGGWRGTDRTGEGDPIPALFMAHEHYALLHRLATRPAPAKTRVEIEVTNKFIPGPIAVYNTVGEIRGSERPDEFVIVGAHLDSWDLAQGTTDNGTGSSVVLETARLLAKCGTAPKRTIRFVLFSGEEQGLHGSRTYVEQHKDEMPRVSMALVHDTGTGRVVGLGLQGREPLKSIFETELVSLKEVGLTEINMRSMSGTDHQSFERVGVPGFACQQDMAEYRFTHHSQSDTFDKAREPDLIQSAQVMAVTAMRVANLPTLLPREKKTEKK